MKKLLMVVMVISVVSCSNCFADDKNLFYKTGQETFSIPEVTKDNNGNPVITISSYQGQNFKGEENLLKFNYFLTISTIGQNWVEFWVHPRQAHHLYGKKYFVRRSNFEIFKKDMEKNNLHVRYYENTNITDAVAELKAATTKDKTAAQKKIDKIALESIAFFETQVRTLAQAKKIAKFQINYRDYFSKNIQKMLRPFNDLLTIGADREYQDILKFEGSEAAKKFKKSYKEPATEI